MNKFFWIFDIPSDLGTTHKTFFFSRIQYCSSLCRSRVLNPVTRVLVKKKHILGVTYPYLPAQYTTFVALITADKHFSIGINNFVKCLLDF